MPSLWPFARDDSSPASFEKALSRLSTQITSSSVSLDKTRTSAHRAKAIWTLWSILAYLVYTTLIALVLGPRQWSLPYYTGLAGAPIGVYGVRRMLALYFDWQIARQQGHLDRLVAERDQKIAQLKKATRYDTTQELLNKYGGSTSRAQSGAKQGTKRKVATPKPPGPQQQRTGLSPPPTANIPGRSPQAGSRPSTPARQIPNASSPPPSMPARSPLSASTSYDLSPDEPGFAPNAFSLPPPPPLPSSTYAPDQQHRWYDRILDVMLGEDETLAKNRLALICVNCRLVNGQAPPGIRSLEEVGRWRCGSCGAWNGVEKAEQGVRRLMQEMGVKGERAEEGGYGEWRKVSRGSEDDGASPELGSEKGGKAEDQDEDEDEVGDAAKDEVPDSPGSDGSDSGEAEEEEAETVAARVAKTKRGSRRAQKK